MLGIGLNSQIAFSGSLISRRIGSAIDDASRKLNRSINSGFNQVSSSINKNTSAIKHLDGTLADEFNNPAKRTIQIVFQNEDGEDEKLSKLFNQVPLFKDELLEGFNKYSDELSVDEEFAIYDEIDKDENLSRVLSCYCDYTFEKDFKYICKYGFEGRSPREQNTPITLPEKYNDTIPYFLYRQIKNRNLFDFWNYVETYREDLKNDIENGISIEFWNECKESHDFWMCNIDKLHYTAEQLAFVRDWNPTEELKKKVNNSIEFRKDIFDYYLKKFNSPLENFIIDLMDKYKKEELNIEVKSMNSDKIILIINNHYLIIKRAPNVNVGNNEF